MTVQPRAAQQEDGHLLGKAVGPCVILEHLGSDPLWSIYRVRHQQFQQLALLLMFFLPAAWNADTKCRFIQQPLQKVASHLPDHPVITPIDNPGLFDLVVYWIIPDASDLVPVLICLFQYKIGKQQKEAYLANQAYGSAPEPISKAFSFRRENWLWHLSCMIEVVTLGGASLSGITVSDALAPTLHTAALIIIVRIAIGGLVSLTGLNLTKYLRQRRTILHESRIQTIYDPAWHRRQNLSRE